MARLRLGVALVLPQPARTAIDAFRNALGDGSLGRIPAHLTLIPPVNVREEHLADALARLRDAAASTEPFDIELGPVTTFWPVTPVLYLEVGGAPGVLETINAMRDLVLLPPLERKITHEFVPHVTVCEETTHERINAAVEALKDFRQRVPIDSVHLLREFRTDDGTRHWRPIADVGLGVRRIVGRGGGMELELTTGRLIDPLAAELLAPDQKPVGGPVVTARRNGEIVGVALGYRNGKTAIMAVDRACQDEGIEDHLEATIRYQSSRTLHQV